MIKKKYTDIWANKYNFNTDKQSYNLHYNGKGIGFEFFPEPKLSDGGYPYYGECYVPNSKYGTVRIYKQTGKSGVYFSGKVIDENDKLMFFLNVKLIKKTYKITVVEPLEEDDKDSIFHNEYSKDELF